MEKEIRGYEEAFRRVVGDPWSLQRTWMKRVLLGRSFAIVAPTGVGKTTFGLITALYLKGKALLLFPTRILASQAADRLTSMEGVLKTQRRILLYESKKRVKEAFLSGEWDVLIGTNMFFHRNHESLLGFSGDLAFIFLDDIDSFLKRGKNVDRLFRLMGFKDREIEMALKRERSERENEILKRIRERPRGTVLVVSSATLRPKGNRVRLFRELLGFDVQKATTSLRNVLDTYYEVESYEKAREEMVELIRRLGKGGLLFLPSYAGRDEVQKVTEDLRRGGLKVVSYLDGRPQQIYEKMKGEDFDVAVGLARINNPLVRGLDLPHIVRYAIFLDVPKFLLPLELGLRPSSLYATVLAVADLLEDEGERLQARRAMSYLRRYLTMREEDLDRYARVKAEVERIRDWLQGILKDPGFLEKVQQSPDVGLVEQEGNLYLVVADASTYLQASGRTSRLVAGGMTLGLSVLMVWDGKAFRSLQKRLRFYFMQHDVEFKNFGDIDLREVLRRIDEDRRRAREILEGRIRAESRDLFRSTLVVVESPNKARTIASFFGRPQVRIVGEAIAYEIPVGQRVLTVLASLGHVLDLVSEGGFFGVLTEDHKYVGIYDTIKRCRTTGEQHTDHDYLRRRCGEKNVEDKLGVLRAIREIGYEVDEVFVATDPDAEGEKIAYDLFLNVRPFNARIKRAEFHEITPRAFKEALENPRDTDLNRVRAQMTRRIADRWVGFTFSRILWKVFKNEHLSAGRVQTPVLGWVIERTKESRRKAYVVGVGVGNVTLERRYDDWRRAREVFNDLQNITPSDVKVIPTGESEYRPLPPYTTDTVLEDANVRLRMDAGETMHLLQELFEKGLITYHRTDSTRVSDFGKYSVAKPYISESFGEEYFYPRSWGEGGAHECIRPTRPLTANTLRSMVAAGLLEIPERALELYDIIFKRFMASQMRPVVALEGKVTVKTLEAKVVLEVTQRGFDLIWPTFVLFSGKSDIGKPFIRKVPRVRPFTDGTLIQEMKRRGLGRPSTYAKIVETLLKRGYVVRSKAGYLYSTPLGERVYRFLMSRYGEYLSEDLTRRIEEAMDRIERGEVDWRDVLKEIYGVRKELYED